MPIQTDNQQLGNINQTIQTTADIGTGAYTAAAAARAGNLFTDVGKSLSSKYGAMYGQQKATQDAMEQINKGAAGQFSHIANFTPYGDAYNAMMDKIAPNVLSADIGHKISLYANQVATDTNITVDKKVETLAKGVQGVIDESVSQLSPEWQDQVKLMTSMQGLDAQNKMVQHVANIQTAQQQIEVKSSLEKLKVQSAQSESVENAMLSYGALKQNLDGLLSTGTISRQEHEAYNQDAKNSIALAQIDKHGMEKFKAWNDSSKMFSEQEMQLYQHMDDVKYHQKQQHKEVIQQQNQWSFDKYCDDLIAGKKPTAPFGLSDRQVVAAKDKQREAAQRQAEIAQRQVQDANDSRLAGNIFMAFKTMSPLEQTYLKAGQLDKLPESYRPLAKQFLALPNKIQSKTLTIMNQFNQAAKDDPYTAYDLKGATGDQIAAFYKSKGINVAKVGVMNEDEAATYRSGLTSPDARVVQQTVEAIQSRYGVISQRAMQQIGAGLDDTSGMSLANNLGQTTSYMNAANKKVNLKQSNWLSNPKLFSSGMSKALQHSSDNDQMEFVSFINSQKSAFPSMTQKEIANKYFDVYNKTVVRKGDEDYLASSELKQVTGSKVRQWRYNMRNDVYQGYDASGNPTPFIISRTKLHGVKPDSLLSNTKKFIDFMKDDDAFGIRQDGSPLKNDTELFKNMIGQ